MSAFIHLSLFDSFLGIFFSDGWMRILIRSMAEKNRFFLRFSILFNIVFRKHTGSAVARIAIPIMRPIISIVFCSLLFFSHTLNSFSIEL